MSPQPADGEPADPARARELEAVHAFVELVIRSSRSPRQRERLERAAGLPVTEAGSSLLRVIATHGPIALSALAERVGLDQSTISRQVRSLESSGLVERAIDPADRRSARVVLSRAGSELLERAHQVALHDYDAALSAWADDDRATLATLLDRFRTSLLEARVDERGWSIAEPPPPNG